MFGRLRQPNSDSVSEGTKPVRNRNFSGRSVILQVDSLAVEAHSMRSATKVNYSRRTLSIDVLSSRFKRPNHSGRTSWLNGGFLCGISTCSQAPCMAVRGT